MRNPAGHRRRRSGMRLLLALLLGACATTRPTSARREPPRVEAPTVVEAPASAGSEAVEAVEVVEAPSATEPVSEPVTDDGPPPRAFFVERVADEAFVLLDTTLPGAPRRVRPRLVGGEGDEVRLDVFPADFAPPLLTPVGETPCPSVRGEPVYVRRNLDPELERHYGDPTLHAAVRIDAGCVPYAAIEGEHPGARLVAFEFDDVEFGDPIVGRAAGWQARIVYPPTMDGICPGFPAAITITPPGRAPSSVEMWALVSTVLAIEDGPHAWLLVQSFTDYSLRPLGAPPVWSHYPTGVDLAEECL